MLAFIFSFALLFAETHGAGEPNFYNKYLNIPGFEAWKFLNLAIFVGLLVYLVKKPLTDAFKAKREAIRADLIKAEAGKTGGARPTYFGRSETRQSRIGKIEHSDTRRAGSRSRKSPHLTANRKRSQKIARADRKRNRAAGAADETRLRRFSAEESIRLAEEKIKNVMNSETDSRLVKASIQSIGGLN